MEGEPASRSQDDVEEVAAEQEAEEEEDASEADRASVDFDARAYGIYQQLPVGREEPDFACGSPQTAEEYLRRVRHEAAQMPDVVVASLDASTLEDKRTRYIPAAAAEPELQADDMDEDWLQQFLEDFATLRLVLRRSPAAPLKLSVEDTPEAWHSYCFGSEDPSADAADLGHEPSLPVLQQLDQRMVSRLLRWHVEWLQGGSALSDASAQWLYALAAVLEKPLQMGSAGMLRQLLRVCAGQPRPEAAAGAARLHVLIAIAGAYFRQDEGLSQVAKAAYM